MRAVGTLANENQAARLVAYLKKLGIESSSEGSFESQTGHMSYQIWVHDEDRIFEASRAFSKFQEAPSDPKFDIPVFIEPLPPKPATPKTPHRFSSNVTNFFFALCLFVYLLNRTQASDAKGNVTPVQQVLFYDLPTDAKAPNFQGAYEWVVLKLKHQDTTSVEGPLFARIREGEVWRLFSPAILHVEFWHILFNMIWLLILGRPIEQRIGPFRTLILTLATGIGANTVQYLMSGPLFLGYSGIVMGLAGFIWMRERIAPWEGYPINKGTMLFLLFFVGAIFCLSVVSFLIAVFTSANFDPRIGNSAHIAGAVIGALLGRLHFFSQRVKT